MAKMTFEVQMEGADRVLNFLKEFNKSYSEMNKTAEMTASQLNKGLNDMATSMKSITSATSGFGAFSKSLREAGQLTKEAFGDAQTQLVNNYGKAVEALTQKLAHHHREMATLRDKAKQGVLTDDQQSQLLEHSQAAAGLQARVDWRKRAASAYAFGNRHQNFQGFAGAFAGMFENAGEEGGLANMLMAPGGVGRALMPFAPYLAVGGAAAFGLRAMTRSNEAGPMLAGREAAYASAPAQQALQGDILTGLLNRSGVGAEARALEGNRGATEALGQGFGVLTGGIGQILSGNFKNPFDTAKQDVIERQRQLSRGEYAIFGEAQQERSRLASMFAGSERAFGADKTQELLGYITGQGVSADSAAPILNALRGQGIMGQPSNVRLARLHREGALSDSMMEMFARRQAFSQRTGGNEAGFAQESQLLARFGAAGLFGAETAPQRTILQESVAADMAKQGYSGFYGAQNYGVGQTAAVGMVQGMAGYAGVAGTQQAIGVAQNQAQGLKTAFDPRRVVMLQQLGKMGLNMREADFFINQDLTNPETRKMLAERVGGGATAESVGEQVGASQDAFSKSYNAYMGKGMEKTDAVVKARLRRAEMERLQKEGIQGPDLENTMKRWDETMATRSAVADAQMSGTTDMGRIGAQTAALTGLKRQYTDPAAADQGNVEISKSSTESEKDKTQAKWQSAAVTSAAKLEEIAGILRETIGQKIDALQQQQEKFHSEKTNKPYEGPK